ncbi:MAG: asparagine synthase-related protein [Nitrospirota bacterium]|jgi:asparagine synthase (glutamine-hydrolysing)
MSGIAVIYGSPERTELEAMSKAMVHRGPRAEGVFEGGRVTMFQNYLNPEVHGEDPGVVPVADGEGARVCFDGQIGNWRELASEFGVPEGPMLEERLLLRMYRELGSGMLKRLGDAIFTFVICDGEDMLAARDLLGIKTLFYANKGGNLYLASELKGIIPATEEVYSFPAGHYMDGRGEPVRYAELPRCAPKNMRADVEHIVEDIRGIIGRSFESRVDFSLPTASLLSGGIDSSVIACIASKAYRGKFGSGERLRTFAFGVGESGDIRNARLVAEHLGTEHHELMVSLDDILEVLPEVIYYLESFDPSLVRSSASNFLISRHARGQGVEVLLSGEGGDEVFCGYSAFKSLPAEEIFGYQIRCLGYLHSNASLRLDRMNMCNSVRVVTPLISGELLDYALCIHPELKIKTEGGQKMEKWIFRKAFENDLPQEVVWRLKQEFSQGSGSAGVLPGYFEEAVSDAEFDKARAEHPILRSKEEFFYHRIFTERFGSGHAVETVGQWPSL